MNRSAEYWIENLKLEKHPEGGWFREIYHSSEYIDGQHLPKRFSGDRSFSTSIYFLLSGKDISVFHKINQDELWYFHDGSPLTIHVLNKKNEHKNFYLGCDLGKNQNPQLVVKAGWFFAASTDNKDGYTLVGCNVAPGFSFDDLEMPSQDQLLKLYPDHKAIISRYSKK